MKIQKLHVIHTNHPKIWATVVFIPMVMTTVLVFPVCLAWECLNRVPFELYSLFSDFIWHIKDEWRSGSKIVRAAWLSWFDAWRENVGKRQQADTSTATVATSADMCYNKTIDR